ncbi:hypothetical protein KIN20_007364 [Parelaphostrongylus tenuis]|uniref:Uncharacterized protein n=1 Tax=Parelaphostrongylus tenuis TaxID=148309 RepID=A0AAD5QGT5_PARTN|nr:hypothetical protein KIN20_007364 [Parelaphostrongylus tenuis]
MTKTPRCSLNKDFGTNSDLSTTTTTHNLHVYCEEHNNCSSNHNQSANEVQTNDDNIIVSTDFDSETKPISAPRSPRSSNIQLSCLVVMTKTLRDRQHLRFRKEYFSLSTSQCDVNIVRR